MLRNLTVLLVIGVVVPGTYGQGTTDKDKPAPQKPALADLAKLLDAGPEALLKRADLNKDGALDKDEVPPVLLRGFERSDRDGNGKLDATELEAMFRSLRQLARPDKPGKPGKPNPEIEKRLDEAFQRLDTNKDGKISKTEARGPMAENFARIDTNNDGVLDREEMRRSMSAQAAGLGGKPGLPPGQAGSSGPDFDALDKDADGRLTSEELKGTRFADKVEVMDTNKDGKIDKKEFRAYLQKQGEKK